MDFDLKVWMTIRGWLDEDEAIWLNKQAQQMTDIIEIGSWCGRSTYCLLTGCKGTVYAIDTFLGSPDEPHWQAYARDAKVYEQFLSNVGKFPNLRTLKMTTQEAIAHVPMVDMVFIDGCHGYEDMKRDLALYGPKARLLLCGHDYTNPNTPGVSQAVNEYVGDDIKGLGSIWYQWRKADAAVDIGRGRFSRNEPQSARFGRGKTGGTRVQDNAVHGAVDVQPGVPDTDRET